MISVPTVVAAGLSVLTAGGRQAGIYSSRSGAVCAALVKVFPREFSWGSTTGIGSSTVLGCQCSRGNLPGLWLAGGAFGACWSLRL